MKRHRSSLIKEGARGFHASSGRATILLDASILRNWTTHDQIEFADARACGQSLRSIGDRNARAFIDFLIEHPDQQFDSERMQQALSFAEHKQVALAAYEIGELAKSLGLARPWSEGQKGYLMTATTAGCWPGESILWC